MKSQKTLSIITAVYNDARNLTKTIKSVRSQSFKDYELIIIDGKSKDDTVDVIKVNSEYISFWVSEADTGIYDAMNKGLKVAGGKYVQFLNAGDTYVNSDCLECIFSDNDDYDVLYGEINVFNPDGDFLFQVPALDFTLDNLRDYGTGTVNHQAFLIKREIAPYFSTRFHLKSELNWYIDILLQNKQVKYKHLPLAIINYSQGGKGFKHFWRNLYEWIYLVQTRFGLKQNIKNRKTYWNFLLYRYPIFRKFLSIFSDRI
jgi:glycosyltransferase involved in cell wall biosynthesis